ncbi:hypothetical protein [Amycolatopsis sp. NBC_01286]|uniref:hypothetical protein n=1 Tax=Amycolatopsis sp. NBC_01286 TaxID=2903560 RepID=UPI002E0F2C4A|nr:hypothetical protein OG570_12300 [Amycolatopsis sp. NBC_01286]
MGKHSRRKSGYLPRVAAGAAPVALLFAAPVSAFAAPSDLTLPIDHRHTTTLNNDGDALTATRRDVVGKRLGDVRLAADRTEAVATGGERAGVAESAHQGVWLGHGVDVLSEHAEQLDTGLFTGDLTGGIAARRSSGQAVDLGQLGAVGTTSEQHVISSFTGVLDVGQKHEVGGTLGPASGLVRTSQSLSSGSFGGDFGVDRVVHVQGGTTSVRGTLDQHPSVSLSALDRPVL